MQTNFRCFPNVFGNGVPSLKRTMAPAVGHRAAGLLLLLLALTGQCAVVYSSTGEAASDKAWEELLKQAIPVSTATVEVNKAAQVPLCHLLMKMKVMMMMNMLVDCSMP